MCYVDPTINTYAGIPNVSYAGGSVSYAGASSTTGFASNLLQFTRIKSNLLRFQITHSPVFKLAADKEDIVLRWPVPSKLLVNQPEERPLGSSLPPRLLVSLLQLQEV
ncbi:hypothetical protein L1987_46467 [Smallanthus sonchifolius]|uniref:Uncharacterized protein n=1 Tax=Smallanthus sonchifolius TaxID=185202 RepID=A0ACB9FZ87_9ASTR|nr:hypothetical protein L1987_46467 [Smallanthus sonchifolius]